MCLIAGLTCPKDVLIEGPGAPRMGDRRGPSFSITALDDGRALVAGGADAPTAETYDPVAGTWTLTAPMAEARWGHSATRLRDGRVLVAGGSESPTAELFDPLTDTWSATGPMHAARRSHTAILLGDGRVLVAGGRGREGGTPSTGGPVSTLRSAEIYDATSGTWSPLPPMLWARDQAHGFADARGDAFVVSGSMGSEASLTVERFDVATARWIPAAAIPEPLDNYDLWGGALSDGRFLLIDGDSREQALLFDPVADRWDVPAVTGHGGEVWSCYGDNLHPSIPLLVLKDGRVLSAGGGYAPSDAETWLFDPRTATWAASGAMGTGRYHHGAVQLTTGEVLVVGGKEGVPVGSTYPVPRYVVTSEVFDPATGTWSPK